MNKKGFTLTEIIGAIIILGILVVIAVVTFTGSMKGFREDYYTDTVRTLTESGKEFFNDNRKYRPSEVLNGQVVPLSTLVSQHYIDDIKDYNGDSCSNSSYVIVIKNGKDDYTYHTCLVCPSDDYSNMNDKYCDASWTNSTTIEYSIATPPELYKYKGIPKSSLKEELGIKVSYVKKNSKGEVLGIVDGTGFDEVPVIYPDNVDAVDPNTLGKYPLTYRYVDQVVEGHVTIYEYHNPALTIKKENVVADTLSGDTKKETGNYASGEWAQKIYISLTAGAVDAGGVDLSTANLSNIVHKYQWNKDGVWQDFCNGDDCSNIEVITEMNESIRFRSIDVNGISSEETRPTIIRIDNTKPVCSIKSDGPHIDNPDWYTGDVNISFVKYGDLVGTLPEAVSDVQIKNITIETGTLNRTSDVLSAIHTQDTKGIKYIGFVEDRAKNFYLCDTSFKRDVTKPVCSLKTDGIMGEHDWYKSATVKTEFANQNDVTSGVREYGIGNYTGDKTIVNPNDTGGITYTGYIKDIAGNTATCTISYKKDSTPPECALKTTGTMGDNNWYKSATVNISFDSATDNLSGVNNYGVGGLTQAKMKTQTRNTTGVTYTGHIKDNAGNLNTCTVTFKKDDGSEAQAGGCSYMGNTTWTDAAWVSQTHKLNVVPISKCKVDGRPYSTYTDDCVHVYQVTIGDGMAVSTRQEVASYFYTQSGIAILCPSYTADIYIDHEPPLCTSSGGNVNWVNTSLSLIGTCDDQSGSGCANNALKLYTTNTEKYNVTPGTVKDKVGNETTCPSNQTVKIDKTAPTCTSVSSITDWTNSTVTVTGICHDTGGSNCVQNIFELYSTQQNSMQSPGTVYDRAGNSAVCPTSVVKIDKTAPTCTSSSSPSGWTNGSVTVTGACADTGGSGCVSGVSRTYSSQQDIMASPGTVYDKAGNSSICPESGVHIDKTAPTCGTVTYGADATAGVNVNVACNDTGGSGCWSAALSPTKESGTVSLGDGAGNSVTCSYRITNYQQHRTRTWNTCKTGNDCVGGYVYSDCATGSPNEPYTGTCYRDKKTCSQQIVCYSSGVGCTTVSNASVAVCNGQNPIYSCEVCTTTQESYSCTKYKNTCKGGDVWSSCASRTPCVGDWNNWGGYSNGACTSGNTSSSQCEERTMYHGG